MLSGNCAWKKRADDEGFTLVEILMASAIMFFVATALFGLVSTSTLLSVTAKADAVAVNAASSFLEQVRRLAYIDVTQARINALSAASSRTVDGVAVSITATVTPQWLAGQNPNTDAPAFKHVAVTVRATPPAGNPLVLTTGTFVGNLRDTGSTGAGPNVELTANTPRGGAVWRSVPLGMNAVSGDPGVALTRLEMAAGGVVIAEKLASAPSDSLSGYWRTDELNPDNTPRFPDGAYVLRASAWDARNKIDQETWSLTVDNHPPDAPGKPTVRSTVANTAVTFGWNPARDGRDWVREYLVEWQIQSAIGPSFSTLGTSQVIPIDPASLVTWTGNTAAFSRYRINVTSLGPVVAGRTPPRFSSQPTSTTFISRPSYAATVTVTDAGTSARPARFDINLTSNTPAFQVDGPVTYRWQVRYGIGLTVSDWTDFGIVSSNPNISRTGWTAPLPGRFRDGWIEFRCLVTLTPSGGSMVQVPSSVVRFTRTAGGTGITDRGLDAWGRWEAPPTVTPAIDWGMWGL